MPYISVCPECGHIFLSTSKEELLNTIEYHCEVSHNFSVYFDDFPVLRISKKELREINAEISSFGWETYAKKVRLLRLVIRFRGETAAHLAFPQIR